MAVIALWLFMEELGYPIIIIELLKYQSDIITNSAYDEAVSAVHYIIANTRPPPFHRTAVTDMNTTLTLIRDSGSAMYVSMKYLFEHGAIGYSSLKLIIGNLCSIMFADILRKAMLKNGFGDNPNDLVNDRADEDTNIPEVDLDNSAPITSLKVEAGSSSGTTQEDFQFQKIKFVNSLSGRMVKIVLKASECKKLGPLNDVNQLDVISRPEDLKQGKASCR
ncbi:hypothetical protein C5167_018066 [Papaver somniferum]|uniref:Uncharacterized protein n=1 Tax=Papaver somniferum TaxID=3469 RepID=A0A4Y7IPK4_PAPSO|nr:hypothetical protein C5167_018066 [Papaver somniferum]